MVYYPVFLDLRGRSCLVIGGGKEAQRKVEGLLAAEGRVTVVSPALTDGLQQLLEAERIEWVQREYRDGDVEGYDVCMVATDDGAVNAQVAAEGKRRRVWVNAADDPGNCDFILPAVIRRGTITVAASTGGASPALARRLREELEAYLTEEMPALAELLKEVRADLRSRGIMPDPEVWQDAIDEELRVLLAQRKQRQAKARLLKSLGAEELVGELVTVESGGSTP
ncbi:MAG: bifunctional precorrin-2 dehydrogenase/sirohydrochlorin ferrochelatase [Dehalococcoidia bacterium]|nr:bifunctional precorrin-2 dehydrogenase/sirohydrochlorin ferrochelatase [Dehalococcoidia bacterium]